MTLSDNLGMYEDCCRAFKAASLTGGATAIFDTHGQAVHWRQRAYRFRRLWRDHTKRIYAGVQGREAEAGRSPWDDWVISDPWEDAGKWRVNFRPRKVPLIVDGAGNEVRTEEEPTDDII